MQGPEALQGRTPKPSRWLDGPVSMKLQAGITSACTFIPGLQHPFLLLVVPSLCPLLCCRVKSFDPLFSIAIPKLQARMITVPNRCARGHCGTTTPPGHSRPPRRSAMRPQVGTLEDPSLSPSLF